MSSLIIDDLEIEHRLQKLEKRYRTVSRLLDPAHSECRAIADTGSNAVHLAYAQNRIIQLTNVRNAVREQIDRLEDTVAA